MNKVFSALVVFLLINFCNAQNTSDTLKFDTQFYNAIDQYVVFPKKEKDSTYAYGFIYIDEMAGVSLRHYGTLKYNKGVFIHSIKNKEYQMNIYRLNKNTSPVYTLKENEFKNLKLPTNPDWLATYKSDAATPEYQKNIGNALNAVGGSQTALSYLEKAYAKEPHLEGLEFELAFAYNALKQFKKAVPVLKNAIKNNAEDFLFYKELGYSYKFLGEIDKAETTYLKGIEIATNNYMKAEMALNMAHSFFELKNKEKFKEWAKITKEYSQPNSQFFKYIDMFEKEWDKN
ncbi:MAG: tetratricopeptide repeat protein [Oceanihabitans sp.]